MAPATDRRTAAPLISVALCTYNGERYLAAQLDSLLAQSYEPLEIVVTDDASSDSTLAILADYARRDPRLRYSRNAANLGFLRNFELTVRACRGSLVALCDQDDVWLPDKLSQLAEALLRGGAAMAFCNSELIDERDASLGLRLPASIQLADFDDPAPLSFHSPCAGHASLVRRDVAERAMPFPAGIYHDWWLSFVAASCGRVVYVDRPLVRYRRHQDSITTRIDEGPKDRQRGFRRRELDEAERKLELFAAFPGRGEEFFRTLLRLWQARKTQFFSYRLAVFMLRHRRRIFLFRGATAWGRIRLALGFGVGLRLKRWLEPRRYAG